MRSLSPSVARGSSLDPASVAVGAAVLAGSLLAAQARINGALATRLGSAVVTALVSFSVGTLVLVLVATAGGRWPAAARLRDARTPWWWLGGLGGAFLVASSAAAVPEAGVAPVAVAIVAGATAGGLVVDAAGLGPRGRHPLTLPRAGGVLLAVAGLGVGAIGADVAAPGLLGLVALAGAATAGQQAANGHLQRVSGDAVVAAIVSFTVGTVALGALTVGLGVTGRLPDLHAPAVAGLYLGGLGGAAYITLSAATVGTLGVLRLTLGTVCGQVLGGLIIDATMPTASRPGWRTVLGAALAVGAVLVTARDPHPSR